MADAPSLAEQARTALAAATAATLATGRCPMPKSLTVVAIQDQPDGRPLVRLDTASPAARLLATCPVATLSVAGPAPFRALQLTGPMNPCRSRADGARAYRMSLLSARLVGAATIPIALGEFCAVAPDPLLAWAPAALRHLERAHAAELLACARARGHDVQAVLPRQIDRYGVGLAGITPDGVLPVRLPFPVGPVDDPELLTAGIRLLLDVACETCRRL